MSRNRGLGPEDTHMNNNSGIYTTVSLAPASPDTAQHPWPRIAKKSSYYSMIVVEDQEQNTTQKKTNRQPPPSPPPHKLHYYLEIRAGTFTTIYIHTYI